MPRREDRSEATVRADAELPAACNRPLPGLRLLQWSPILPPVAAGLILVFWPAAWVPIFGKETASEHLNHGVLLATCGLYFATWYRDRVPGLLLLALGTLAVLIEEVDYGYLYAGVHVQEALHNTPVGVWGLLLAEICFAALPFLVPADRPLLARWLPITRPAAVAVGCLVAMLLAVQVTDHAVHGYRIREGADEIHDLGVALALFAMAVRLRVLRIEPPRTGPAQGTSSA
jgi:hypothetical protein